MELRACDVSRREAQSEFKKAALGKTMVALSVFTAHGLSGMLAIRFPFTFVHGNESDKAGKRDSIRCDRVNVDIPR